MIGASIGARPIGEAGLRALASEWGGARPGGAGTLSGGARRASRERRRIVPRR
jgi:hypothetical protein